jgi:acetamidase/formamidase
MTQAVPTFDLTRGTFHQFWDRSLVPELSVAAGAELALELRDGSSGQITPGMDPEALFDVDFTKMDPLTGPIFVEGAHVGDALAIEILDISLGSWGWSGIMPNFGLLADHFPGPLLRTWDLREGHLDIGEGVRFEFRPMIGVIGVAPPEPGQYSSVVPTRSGGNIDVKYTQVGSRVLLPVSMEGALLSLGDAHALQGDGELSGTAIECEADVVIKIDVVRGANLRAPIIETPAPGSHPQERFRSFLGVGPDLFEAAREASLQAAEAVAKALRLDQAEAYALLGTIADLSIHEVVDRPNWVVGCMVPLRVFGNS